MMIAQPQVLSESASRLRRATDTDWKSLLHVDDLSYALMEVTPETATEMLRKVGPSARNDEKDQARYAEAMRSGGWVYNGQPLIFARDGTLLDGYQRLKACVQAKSSFRTLVAFGVSPDTLHSIDQQRSRSFANVLEARGFEHGATISSVITKLIRIENGVLKLASTPYSWWRMEAVFDANRDELIEAVGLAAEASHMRISQVAKATAFFMALKAGHGPVLRAFIADYGDSAKSFDNPARNLANNIESMRAAETGRRIDVDVETAMLILALTDAIVGARPTGPYIWTPDYGKGVKLRKTGRPVSMAQARRAAPANCGLPTLPGFQGTIRALVEDIREADWRFFHGRTAEELIRVAGRNVETDLRHVLLTPETAKQLLDRFNTGNRKIQKTHVEKIASDIRKGFWMVNAQPICFHGDPFADGARARLLNGQHRLMACIKAETPIEVVIATGIPEEAFATFDVHGRRSKVAGDGDVRVLESAAVFLWRKEQGIPLSAMTRPTAMEIADVLQRHPETAEFYRITRLRNRASGAALVDFCTAGVMTFFLTHIHGERPDLAPAFMEELQSGVVADPSNPVLKGRSRLAMGNRVGERMTRKDSLDFLMKLWDNYKKWRSRKGRDTEENRSQAMKNKFTA